MLNHCLRRLSPHLTDFAQETGVFGFNLLCFSLSTVEAIFWCLCTTLFVSLTIRDIANLSLSFLSEDTVTLTTKMANSTIVLDPPPTFAVSHGFDGFVGDFQPLQNQSHFVEMLDQFLEVFRNRSSLDEMNDIDRDLIQLFALMLHDIAESEIEVVIIGNDTRSWAFDYKNTKDFVVMKSTMKTMYARSEIAGVDFSKLLRFIAAKICKNLNISVTINTDRLGSESVSSCDEANMLGLDQKTITFRTTKNPVTFSDFGDYLFMKWNAREYRSPPTIYFDVTGTALTMTETEDSDATLQMTYNKANERITVSMRISGAYQMEEAKRSQPCSRSESRYDCKQRCYIDEFVKLCGCYPIYFAVAYERRPTDVAMCPKDEVQRSDDDFVPHVLRCAKLNSTTNIEMNECMERCLPTCYSKTFVTTTDRTTRRLDTSEDSYELELNVRSFVFPFFQEKLAMSFDNFMSQFGGVLGLYLGISFAALIHIPVFIARKLLQRFRKPSSPSLNRHDGVEAVQFDGESRDISDISLTNVGSRQPVADGDLLRRLDAMDRRFALIERILKRAESRHAEIEWSL